MTSILLDTHVWAWSLTDDDRLPEKVVTLIGEAESVFVSPIAFFEIGQKVRIGKWPEMVSFIDGLPDLLARQGGHIASLTPEICLTAATMEWPHRDPFDRIQAASAIASKLTLVSADAIFDELTASHGIIRFW